MQLTQHFKLSEFEKSSTARARGINNSVPANLIPNIKKLCEQVLEPLRQHVGKPVVIGSGYRCPALNRAVGGATPSQHMKGEAADLHLPSIAIGRTWIEHLLEFGMFDQLIWEHDKSGHYWIHISFKRTGRNRQTYLPNLLKK